MLGRTRIIMIAALVVVAGCASNVTRAKDYMQAGMYAPASKLLEKEISEYPTNAEAHFELGTCYLNLGKEENADARFNSAVHLKRDYGQKISEAYKKAGLAAVDRGRSGEGKAFLMKAVTYQPGLKNGLVADLIAGGRTSAQQGNVDQADSRFSAAILLDSNRKKEVCDAYAGLGDAASDSECLNLYQRAARFCDVSKGPAGRRLLDIAKNLAKLPGREKDKEEYKETAGKFLGADLVEAELPDVKYFSRGRHKLGEFKKGEQTPFWIGVQAGDTFSINFLTSKGNKNIIVVTDSGKKFHLWLDQERDLFTNTTFSEEEQFKLEFQDNMEAALVVN